MEYLLLRIENLLKHSALCVAWFHHREKPPAHMQLHVTQQVKRIGPFTLQGLPIVLPRLRWNASLAPQPLAFS